MAESLGPVQYMVLGFPGNKFKGEIAPELGDLVNSGLIRIMDLAFVVKDADENVACLELEDLNEEESAPFAAFEREVGDLLNEEDLMLAAEALAPDSSAAVLVWENLWAKKFADAVRDADGVLLGWDRIPYEAVEAAIEAQTKTAD